MDSLQLNAALDDALSGRLCVQGWVGYGSCLFIGFGDDVLPPVAKGESHPIPMYELQTSFVDWRVGSPVGIIGTGDDEHDKMTEAVESLVGHTVNNWHVDANSFALRIEFENGLSFEAVPLRDEDVIRDEAWWIRMPSAYYLGVNCDGTLFTGQS